MQYFEFADGIESVDIEPNLSDGKFVIGMSESGKLVDFPRYEDGMPKIVDPRNDDNKILAQITVVCSEFMVARLHYPSNQLFSFSMQPESFSGIHEAPQ